MKRSGFSKEEVYRRLVKNASELWNIHETELDSMDPLAKMLLGATAKEIERIGNELYSSDARIFKRIAQFLLPDELQSAVPAHSVVRLEPSEEGEITRYDELTFEKRWRDKSDLNKIHSRDISFSSAGEFNTSAHQLVYRAQGNSLYSVSDMRFDEVASFDRSIPEQEVYLGFRKKGEGDSQIRLYFDWLNIVSKKRLFDQVHKIRVHDLEGDILMTRPGIEDPPTSYDLNSTVQLRSKLEEKVVSYYNERFLRIDVEESDLDFELEFLSESLEEAGESDPKSIFWLKLLLPHDLEPHELHEVHILDNCVPVLNRKLEKSIFRLHKELNIKKLDFNNFFLEVEKSESNKGDSYRECPSLELMEMKPGSFSIRLGGTGRLDERDGYEYLNYLLDLLRDEKQSFSALDMTSTVSDLKTIEQILQKVKKKVKSSTKGSKQPYVIVKPFGKSENAHLFYWTTDGLAANEIPFNSALSSKNPGICRSGKALMISKTVGGRNELESKEMIRSYKTAVLSRGMVVTRADIYARCEAVAGEALQKISIQNGIVASPKKRSGLLKTMDVCIQFKNEVDSEEEREHVRQQIESELLATSNFSRPLRVMISAENG